MTIPAIRFGQLRIDDGVPDNARRELRTAGQSLGEAFQLLGNNDVDTYIRPGDAPDTVEIASVSRSDVRHRRVSLDEGAVGILGQALASGFRLVQYEDRQRAEREKSELASRLNGHASYLRHHSGW